MTTVQTPTREEANAERDDLARHLVAQTGTDNREELRDMALHGELGPRDAASVDRLRELDYLLT